MPPPERWDAYSPMGNVIPGTRFIAFKVPLKEALLQTVPEDEKFSPSILVAKLGQKGLVIAGIIDLTYTWKYYRKEDFVSKSIDHKKVFTKGHEVPSDATFKEFMEAVESFSENDKLIGVHCTHGVNRTGYLICRYMIEKMNIEPQDAINLFNTARGHDLERENYLEDLKKRKSGELSWGLIPPPEPENERQGKKKKPRWRHHREDHPDWRQRGQDNKGWEPYRPAPARDNSSQWRDRNPYDFPANPQCHFSGERNFMDGPNHFRGNYSSGDWRHDQFSGQHFSQGGGANYRGSFHDRNQQPMHYQSYDGPSRSFDRPHYLRSDRGRRRWNEDNSNHETGRRHLNRDQDY